MRVDETWFKQHPAEAEGSPETLAELAVLEAYLVQRFTVVDNADTYPNGLTALSSRPILAAQGGSPCFPFSTARILMALHEFVFVFLLIVCLLLSLVLLWRLDWFPLRSASPRGAAKRTRLPRLLKPRTPDDCPACRLTSTPSSGKGPASAPVRPWNAVKGRRGGVPKRIGYNPSRWWIIRTSLPCA